MRLIFRLALAAFLAAQGWLSSHGGVAAAGPAPSRRASADAAAQRGVRRKTRRGPRSARRGKKSMPQTGPTEGPVTDAPNREEIDPGDIPPHERPRDPNVDDRTRIPGGVSPDDMAPRPARPRPKRRRP